MKLITNELLPVYETDLGHKVVVASELHEFLGVSTRYNDWFRLRVEKYGFVEDEDFYLISSKSTGGRPVAQYIVKLDAAKELCMVENNEQGRRARRYFIEIEKRFNQAMAQFQIPQSYSEALRAYADEVEKTVRLEAQITQQAPKVALYDTAMNAKNNMSMAAVAKTLGFKGFGRNNLFAFLRDRKILMANNDPYQEYIDRGYFEVRQYPITHFSTGIENKTQTLVTPKGMDYIFKLLANERQKTLVKVGQ